MRAHRMMAACILAACLAACGDEEATNDTTTPATDATTAETADDVATTPDATETAVAEVACTIGERGCACDTGDVCATGLQCAAGRCIAGGVFPCAPGATGCACAAGDTCARASDRCGDGVCKPNGCAPGTNTCACIDGQCGPGLGCLDGVCRSGVGALGGACFADATCNAGNRCQGAVCVPCALGSNGCACIPSASDAAPTCSGSLACTDGICRDAGSPGLPPSAPKCYTPCEQGFTDAAGKYHGCPADHLMPDCLAPNECVAGSCVVPGGAPSGCEADRDCTDSQTCILGTCYANCDGETECGSGETCYRHVCRQACTTVQGAGSVPCPALMYCNSDNGTLGACMPLAVPTDTATQTEVTAELAPTPNVLALTNEATGGSFTLTNDSPTPRTVTVRKLRHTRWLADGTAERRSAAADCAGASCPLAWVSLAARGEEADLAPSVEIEIDAGSSATIDVATNGGGAAPRWFGTLEVTSPGLNVATVELQYNESLEGSWRGRVYYFSSFGTNRVDDWRQLPNAGPGSAQWSGTRDDPNVTIELGNALLQRWVALRVGNILWREFQAVLTATETESWKWPSIQQKCGSANAVCYPYDDSVAGLGQYTSDTTIAPVPSGVTELPIAMNLRLDPAGQGKRLIGRIESQVALQYAGNPSVSVAFQAAPDTCSRELGGLCLDFIESLSADVLVGGRYTTTATDTSCSKRPGGSYDLARLPWLVPGFIAGTALASDTGQRYHYECRDGLLPSGTKSELNRNLALSNPVPDARTRRRSLRLVDGALINRSQLFILFEERFDSFLGSSDTTGFSAYGYMILDREPGTPKQDDANQNHIADIYEGNKPSDARVEPASALGLQCSTELVQSLLGGTTVDATTASGAVQALLGSAAIGGQVILPLDPQAEEVHFLCEDTGRFEGGPPNQREPCPEGSRIMYFTLNPQLGSTALLINHACQVDRSCAKTLAGWTADDEGSALVQKDPPWRCTDTTTDWCTNDRLDPRKGKTFYKIVASDALVLQPIGAAVDDAFTYKTKFARRGTGDTVGFTPTLCTNEPTVAPYCYDATAIEEARDRVDCILYIWHSYYPQLTAGARQLLDAYLSYNLSSKQTVSASNVTTVRDGFERLYAELQVMLGDEAYTQALSSRFDLAQTQVRSFEGSLFEPGGIDVSGIAGSEMVLLHRALQYYDLALDRFYGMSPLLWDALSYRATPRNFVTAEAVLTYFDRLVNASTHRARTASEIARRYQNFNRPDLAKNVIERAYTRSYLESIVMSRMMLRIVQASDPEKRSAIERAREDAQLRYRISLADMRKVYTAITDDVNYFGYAPGFIPFPTVDVRETNAFENIMLRVKTKINIGKEREDVALATARTFDTDAAEFQSELVRIRNTYENQLADLCGVFTGTDALVHPAIAKYGNLDARAQLYGDPCGLLGNGQIHAALGQFEQLGLDLKRVQVEFDNVGRAIEIERERHAAQCNLALDKAKFVYHHGADQVELTAQVQMYQLYKEDVQYSQQVAATLAGLGACNGLQCATAAGSGALYVAYAVASQLQVHEAQEDINERELEIAQLSFESANWEYVTGNVCAASEIDSVARMRELALRTEELQLELLRADHAIRLQLAELQRLRLEARRLQDQQREAEQLAIDTEAARNDPNIRIYRNDAVINADFAFEDALREVYRATLVLEYYTSQTYAKRDQLYLIRMIHHGDINLENYAVELDNAFIEFEDQFGLPDTRVAVISLQNDILHIPYLDEDGVPLGQPARNALMRKALADPRNLDANGYLTLPFRTDTADLSPITRNHKILYIEAGIDTSAKDDLVARIYLRQQGTATVHALGGGFLYYQFPTKTAVINPFFNGNKDYFEPDTYQSRRLRDRPYASTDWQLVINQRDEPANQDLDLQKMTDLKLFIYYSDFNSL